MVRGSGDYPWKREENMTACTSLEIKEIFTGVLVKNKI